MRFFPAFCFSSSFFLARDVPAVTLCQDVLAERFHRFARDDLRADRRLHCDIEHLARYELAHPRGEIPAAVLGRWHGG